MTKILLYKPQEPSRKFSAIDPQDIACIDINSRRLNLITCHGDHFFAGVSKEDEPSDLTLQERFEQAAQAMRDAGQIITKVVEARLDSIREFWLNEKYLKVVTITDCNPTSSIGYHFHGQGGLQLAAPLKNIPEGFLSRLEERTLSGEFLKHTGGVYTSNLGTATTYLRLEDIRSVDLGYYRSGVSLRVNISDDQDVLREMPRIFEMYPSPSDFDQSPCYEESLIAEYTQRRHRSTVELFDRIKALRPDIPYLRNDPV